MNVDKFKNKGLSGLYNLGNTCFINSCVQILSHTYELNLFFDSSYFKKLLNIEKDETNIIIEWNNLRKQLWKTNTVVTPLKFINSIQSFSLKKGNNNFSGFLQNDITEFLLFIIDIFHNSISNPVNININGNIKTDTDQIALTCFKMIQDQYSIQFSEIINLFYSIQISKITSLENNKILSIKPEPYFIINLPIPQHIKVPSLYDCFDLYTQSEALIDENAWYNEETKQKVDINKTICFWNFPKILVIDIKRFNSNNVKNKKLITFPLNKLNLSKYSMGYHNDKCVYDLYGVCNHSGGVLGGHYTSYIKNANNKWYHFNDTVVNEVLNLNVIVHPNAYCFFYRKQL